MGKMRCQGKALEIDVIAGLFESIICICAMETGLVLGRHIGTAKNSRLLFQALPCGSSQKRHSQWLDH